MRAVFLDADSLGPRDIDFGPLQDCLPDLERFASTPPDQVAERIAGAAVVLVNKVRLDGTVLASAPDLRLICLAATGTDNVDLTAARERGVVVCNIRDYCTPSVVQHVYALALALNQRLIPYRQLLADGAWARSPHFCLLDHPIRELSGKTLGIIGFGALGSAVARAAPAFGLDVIAARRPYNLDAPAGPDGFEHGAVRTSYRTLLERADIISLHCPLNADTAELIDAESLALMGPGTLLLNTARGGLVKSRDLLAALRTGAIGGAGIDVLAQEPPPADDPLVAADLPNLIVTPHIAWAAREARQRTVAELAANVAAFLRGEDRNRVA
jgi:glycerate dehydrogenase